MVISLDGLAMSSCFAATSSLEKSALLGKNVEHAQDGEWCLLTIEVMNRTIEAMDTIGMKDVPSSLYNGSCVDNARDSLSCTEGCSFGDDGNNFSRQELNATKQNVHDLISQPYDAFIALQDLCATKEMDRDLILGRHMTSIPVGVTHHGSDGS